MNLYHYCSNVAFLAIIESREIRASDLSLSNDTLEGRWVREIFSEYCSEKKVSPLDKLALLDQLDGLISFFGGTGFCMSEEPDLLSQWRGYADDGAGVSIGFSKEYFETLQALKRDRNDEFNASLTKVEYDVAEQKKLMAEHADEIFKLVSKGAIRKPTLLTPETEEERKEREANAHSLILRFTFFFFYLYAFKNPAFAEEREWRILSYVIDNKGDKGDHGLDNMMFRGLRDRIVPYRSIPLEPLDRPAIMEIVLGPKNLTPERVVAASLKKYGWPDVQVRRSKASYR
jgi:DUF2971 family protein